MAPGLPDLVRDMATDNRALANKAVVSTRPVARKIPVEFKGERNVNRKRYVVIPCAAGLLFATVDQEAGRATASTGSGAGSVPATAPLVIARLEHGARRGTGGIRTVQQRFVLENSSAFSDGEDAITKNVSHARNITRRDTNQDTRRVSMRNTDTCRRQFVFRRSTGTFRKTQV